MMSIRAKNGSEENIINGKLLFFLVSVNNFGNLLIGKV